jgi:hypothetical protein
VAGSTERVDDLPHWIVRSRTRPVLVGRSAVGASDIQHRRHDLGCVTAAELPVQQRWDVGFEEGRGVGLELRDRAWPALVKLAPPVRSHQHGQERVQRRRDRGIASQPDQAGVRGPDLCRARHMHRGRFDHGEAVHPLGNSRRQLERYRSTERQPDEMD